MPKMARGATGASSVTSARVKASPSAGRRISRCSRTEPPANATTSSPRTSPALGVSSAPVMNVASFMARGPYGLLSGLAPHARAAAALGARRVDLDEAGELVRALALRVVAHPVPDLDVGLGQRS